MRSFASDNYAGAHPEVLAAIAEANAGHAVAYGDDPWTERARAAVRVRLGEHADPYFVFNGTGANVLCLAALCRSWEAVICADTAHLHTDEAAAPEIAGRVKLLPVSTPDGKLTPELCAAQIVHVGDEHASQARVVSIAQSTELGTVYTPDEVRALADFAHARGLYLHVDGARLFNAAAAVGASLHDLVTDAGVDALSLGVTKIGALGAEAAIFLAPDVSAHAKWVRKQLMQLSSKHRFLAVQFEALLSGGLADRAASHANAMAARLAAAVGDVPGVSVTRAPQANALFAILPAAATEALQADWPFYVWDEHTGEVRWMCSWDTTEDDVDAFVMAVRAAVS
ncbi:MAG: threonine aldolase [Solirubrobacteraceae bacterium]|jgi:threonine aldolase|nr:threonine aldolase [Solirubrobacteraceae bacterium]